MKKKEQKRLVMFKWGDIEIYINEKDAAEYKRRMIELGNRIEKLN